ncbi:hypothetical protein GGR57DRAFT_519664 [Xylariaceae sp. FL1272]|nr:hypothetical protein GGR57DRAFT_519664 [Xylariaceae sp. FL1272]
MSTNASLPNAEPLVNEARRIVNMDPGSDLVAFTMFNQLPPELRLMIWEHALAEELTRRRLSVYQTRIIALKHLNSPLLSVNAESRSCALRLYNTVVEVYRVPSPKPHEARFDEYVKFQLWREQRPGSEDDRDWHTYYLESEASNFGSDPDIYGQLFGDSTFRNVLYIENYGMATGILRLSTEYDTFGFCGEVIDDEYIEFLSFLEPFWVDAAAKIRTRFNGRETTEHSFSWQYITARLDAPDVRALQNVVLAPNCRFSDGDVSDCPKFNHLRHCLVGKKRRRYP